MILFYGNLLLNGKLLKFSILFFFSRRKDDPIYVSQKSLKLFLENASQGNVNRSRIISSKTNAVSRKEQWYLQCGGGMEKRRS